MRLKNGSFYLRKRIHRPYIMKHKKFNPLESDEKNELYYTMLLKLFKPWRKESDIIVSGLTSFETYCIEVEKYPEMVNYHEKLVSKFKIDKEFEEKVRERAKVIHQNEIDNETTIFEEIDDSNNAIQGEVIDRAADAMEDLTAANRQILEFDTMDQLQSDYKSLNIDQRRIVDKVMAIINGGNTQKSLKMFVSGFGGTRKSRVIDVTRRMLYNQSSKEICPVVVMPPTRTFS